MLYKNRYLTIPPFFFQTLSSLALVFALHHYKPTPLYVMDEIDAALGNFSLTCQCSYSCCPLLFEQLHSWQSNHHCRFQECLNCWPLCKGSNQRCTIYNNKVFNSSVCTLFSLSVCMCVCVQCRLYCVRVDYVCVCAM